jgi:formylglycine-generating enzyme required for sulfatase activity
MGASAEETAGLFLPGKETQHEVTLSAGFWLAETTVTQELWLAVMSSNASIFISQQNPVERVSWLDAQQFLERLNRLIPGLSARLPAEVEWEHACRAGSKEAYSFGSAVRPDQVNYNCAEEDAAQCRRRTVAVKTLPANAWGLHEMHGNVQEWCQDAWQDDLGFSGKKNAPEEGSLRVVRGGSWACRAEYVRSASRDRYYADWRGGSIGFRLAV